MGDALQIACVGCGATASCKRGTTIGAQAKETGFEPFFNTANGLETVWACPVCTSVVKAAATELRRVFGKTLKYIHMGNVASLAGDTE